MIPSVSPGDSRNVSRFPSAEIGVQRAEPLEEVVEIAHDGVAKHLRRPVLVGTRDPLGQVIDQAGELVDERLLGQSNGLLEPGPDPLLLALVEPGASWTR